MNPVNFSDTIVIKHTSIEAVDQIQTRPLLQSPSQPTKNDSLLGESDPPSSETLHATSPSPFVSFPPAAEPINFGQENSTSDTICNNPASAENSTTGTKNYTPLDEDTNDEMNAILTCYSGSQTTSEDSSLTPTPSRPNLIIDNEIPVGFENDHTTAEGTSDDEHVNQIDVQVEVAVAVDDHETDVSKTPLSNEPNISTDAARQYQQHQQQHQQQQQELTVQQLLKVVEDLVKSEPITLKACESKGTQNKPDSNDQWPSKPLHDHESTLQQNVQPLHVVPPESPRPPRSKNKETVTVKEDEVSTPRTTTDTMDNAKSREPVALSSVEKPRRKGKNEGIIIFRTWKLGKTIGNGSSGSVKLVTHLATDQVCVVKCVHRPVDKEPAIVSRNKDGFCYREHFMLREALVGVILDHPNIIKMHSYVVGHKHFYFFYEHMPGMDLADYVAKHGRLTEKMAWKLFQQIVSAIEYAHRSNVIHRDIKLENIRINPDTEEIKVLDFGFATFYSSNFTQHSSCGSPCYAAPEIYRHKPYRGPEVDVWSLGICLYGMVVGVLPFYDQHLHKDLDTKNQNITFPAHLSHEITCLISQMLKFDGKERATLSDVMHSAWMTNQTIKPQTVSISSGSIPPSPTSTAAAAECMSSSSTTHHPLAIINSYKNQVQKYPPAVTIAWVETILKMNKHERGEAIMAELERRAPTRQKTLEAEWARVKEERRQREIEQARAAQAAAAAVRRERIRAMTIGAAFKEIDRWMKGGPKHENGNDPVAASAGIQKSQSGKMCCGEGESVTRVSGTPVRLFGRRTATATTAGSCGDTLPGPSSNTTGERNDSLDARVASASSAGKNLSAGNNNEIDSKASVGTLLHGPSQAKATELEGDGVNAGLTGLENATRSFEKSPRTMIPVFRQFVELRPRLYNQRFVMKRSAWVERVSRFLWRGKVSATAEPRSVNCENDEEEEDDDDQSFSEIRSSYQLKRERVDDEKRRSVFRGRWITGLF
ncbi:serine/threonine-protein kinase KIN2 [Blyttiomyces sp. JEL0837]|nr:serine/threonine-protein kinase KIN2 [Blyttiomyces sp. JEL0837]